MTEKKRNVYVGNLSCSATKDNLRVLFKQFGNIERIFIAAPAAGAKYTYGFVQFENQGDASRAIDKLTGIFLHGRRLRIERGCQLKDENQMILSQTVPPKEREDQNFTQQQNEANNRGKYLTLLKNIYSEVCRTPVRPGPVQLLELVHLIEEINRLPLTSGPVYGQKKPQCFLDLDDLDVLSEEYYAERKLKAFEAFVS